MHSAGVALVNYRQSFIDPLAVGILCCRFFCGCRIRRQVAWELTDAPSVFRATAFYRLEHPLELTPWLSFRPIAGFRQTYYDEGVGARLVDQRTIGGARVGFDLWWAMPLAFGM